MSLCCPILRSSPSSFSARLGPESCAAGLTSSVLVISRAGILVCTCADTFQASASFLYSRHILTRAVPATLSGRQRCRHRFRWGRPDCPCLCSADEVSGRQIVHFRHPLQRRGFQPYFHGERLFLTMLTYAQLCSHTLASLMIVVITLQMVRSRYALLA